MNYLKLLPLLKLAKNPKLQGTIRLLLGVFAGVAFSKGDGTKDAVDYLIANLDTIWQNVDSILTAIGTITLIVTNFWSWKSKGVKPSDGTSLALLVFIPMLFLGCASTPTRVTPIVSTNAPVVAVPDELIFVVRTGNRLATWEALKQRPELAGQLFVALILVGDSVDNPTGDPFAKFSLDALTVYHDSIELYRLWYSKPEVAGNNKLLAPVLVAFRDGIASGLSDAGNPHIKTNGSAIKHPENAILTVGILSHPPFDTFHLKP